MRSSCGPGLAPMRVHQCLGPQVVGASCSESGCTAERCTWHACSTWNEVHTPQMKGESRLFWEGHFARNQPKRARPARPLQAVVEAMGQRAVRAGRWRPRRPVHPLCETWPDKEGPRGHVRRRPRQHEIARAATAALRGADVSSTAPCVASRSESARRHCGLPIHRLDARARPDTAGLRAIGFRSSHLFGPCDSRVSSSRARVRLRLSEYVPRGTFQNQSGAR